MTATVTEQRVRLGISQNPPRRVGVVPTLRPELEKPRRVSGAAAGAGPGDRGGGRVTARVRGQWCIMMPGLLPLPRAAAAAAAAGGDRIGPST